MNKATASSATEWLDALTPLIQTVLWLVVALVALIVLRTEIRQLRAAIGARLTGGAAVKLGPLELGALVETVESVKGQVETLSDRVSRAFLLSMSEAMYGNLQKLATGKFGPFEKTGGLERELRYLRDIGYIDVPSVNAIPASGENLSDFVTVTPSGRSFVSLRGELGDTGHST